MNPNDNLKSVTFRAASVFTIVMVLLFPFSVATALDIPPIFVMKWGTLGTDTSQFQWPNGVAIDGEGSVYVTDMANNRMQKFNSDGTFLIEWGTYGGDDGQFFYPNGVVIDSNDNAYVTDMYNRRIQKFNSNGIFLTKWGMGGSLDDQVLYPKGIAMDSDGNFYVSDGAAGGPGQYFKHRIQKFDSNGNSLLKWGTYGSADGQFKWPEGVAVDNENNVYVADTENHRIQKFDSNGSFLTKWGTNGSGDGQFLWPRGVAVDNFGDIYVTDTGNNRIQKFDSNGNFLTKWGMSGSGDGQFSFPTSIAMNDAGYIYVVDQGNHRVQVFSNAISVSIDIKPGSDSNCFNSNGNGVIPVAILGSETFDASTVDPMSVTLDGAEVRTKGKSDNAGALEDVNGDGFLDLVVQIVDDSIYTGDTTAYISGSTWGGEVITGSDEVCIRPPE